MLTSDGNRFRGPAHMPAPPQALTQAVRVTKSLGWCRGVSYGASTNGAGLDLFLLLTALLCGLTGTSRAAVSRAPAVEASRVVQVVRAALPRSRPAAAVRPEGDVASEPWPLDLAFGRDIDVRITPERRRE